MRGWLECDARQLESLHRLITPHPAGYKSGWAFRAREFNWTCFAFYGGDIRSAEIEWFGKQVRAMAALPASDEDGDRVAGVFLVSAEGQPMAQWQIKQGCVAMVPADAQHAYLDA